jgi:hypothetical protein
MAETTIPASGADPSKLNTYNLTEKQLEKYNEAQEAAVKALETRYLQPNLFKVAAGFLKPQLGGFGASLGSASEALGENLEQQRASALPIAQMRAQLAQSQMLLGSKKKASEIAESAKGKYTPEQIAEISNYDPERGARIAQTEEIRQKTIQNNREMTINNAKAVGLPIPPMNEMGLPLMSQPALTLNDKPISGEASNPASINPNASATRPATALPPPEEVQNPKNPNGPIILKTPGSEFSPLNPSEATKSGNERLYKTLDDQGANHINELTHLASDFNHSKIMRPIKNVLKYSDDPRFNEVMGILSGNGLLSSLGALVENGLHVSAAEFNASLAIPLSKVVMAGKDANTVAFAQNVYRDLAQIELNNQRSMGVNPSSARNAELGLISSAAAHPETLPSAARLYAKQSELGQLRNRDMYKDIEQLIHGKHKYYKVDPDSPTKMYLYMTSPSQGKIASQYDSAFDSELEKYLKATGEKK